MSEDPAPNTNAPEAPAAPATTINHVAIPVANEAIIARCLETKRPVYRQIENILPDYLRWCSDTFHHTLLQSHGEPYHDDNIEELLTRITRLTRRIGRMRGPEAAVDEMLSRPYAGVDFAFECTARDEEAQLGIFDDSEDEDAFEVAYMAWESGNVGGGTV